MGKCTLRECLWKCINPSSDDCKKCAQDNCFPAAVACTGVPMWAFPP